MIQLKREKYCQDCFFFNPTVSGEWSDGYCRRHAPMSELILTTERGTGYDPEGQWPRVHRKDWCGDFQEKKK